MEARCRRRRSRRPRGQGRRCAICEVTTTAVGRRARGRSRRPRLHRSTRRGGRRGRRQAARARSGDGPSQDIGTRGPAGCRAVAVVRRGHDEGSARRRGRRAGRRAGSWVGRRVGGGGWARCSARRRRWGRAAHGASRRVHAEHEPDGERDDDRPGDGGAGHHDADVSSSPGRTCAPTSRTAPRDPAAEPEDGLDEELPPDRPRRRPEGCAGRSRGSAR